MFNAQGCPCVHCSVLCPCKAEGQTTKVAGTRLACHSLFVFAAVSRFVLSAVATAVGAAFSGLGSLLDNARPQACRCRFLRSCSQSLLCHPSIHPENWRRTRRRGCIPRRAHVSMQLRASSSGAGLSRRGAQYPCPRRTCRESFMLFRPLPLRPSQRIASILAVKRHPDRHHSHSGATGDQRSDLLWVQIGFIVNEGELRMRTAPLVTSYPVMLVLSAPAADSCTS
jgi:hypothetical protein